MTEATDGQARALAAPTWNVVRAPAGARVFAVAAALIAGIWLAACSLSLLSDSVVPWDSKNQFYAFFRFLASSLEAGQSPLWNPYHYGGHPSVGDPQSLIFSPLFVLWALFDRAPSLRSFDLLVFAHLLLGGVSIAAIGARARWPVAACVLAAAIFMFGGAAAGRLQHTGIVISYGPFPLALLLLQLALERRSLALSAAFAFVAAAIALGRNQVAMLLCFVLAAAAIVEIAGAQRPLRYLRERAPVLAAMGAISLALIAAPMLLTFQFAALSNRPAVTIGEALLGSLHPAALAQLVVPDVFGTHGPHYWGPSEVTEPAVALTDDSFVYLFVGSVPVLLLLWLGVAGGYALRRGRLFLTVVAMLALVYALGRYTPLFGLAFDWMPGVSRFRRPVDADFVFLAAFALLCGHLLADYVREGVPRLHAVAMVALAGGALAALAAAIAFSARTGHAGDALLAIARTVVLVAALAGVLAFVRRASARATAAAVMTAIAVGELLWWNAAFRLNADARADYAVLERPAPAVAAALSLVERAVAERRRAGARPRVEIMGLGGPWQNIAMVRSLEAINGYNPLRIGAYDRLIAPGEANWQAALRTFPASFDGYDCALARALGLEFVILGSPIETVPRLARLPVADVLLAGPQVWVYRLRNASPRVAYLRHVQVADADAAIGANAPLALPSPDRVLIDDDTPPRRSYGAGAAVAGSARMLSWQQDRVEIAVDSVLGGMLVLHDLWYPGWVAEIDGARAPILRADILFRGVEVPPGRHVVTFRYAPFSWENLRDALRVATTRR